MKKNFSYFRLYECNSLKSMKSYAFTSIDNFILIFGGFDPSTKQRLDSINIYKFNYLLIKLNSVLIISLKSYK